jgi:hypothetical protein
MGVDQVSLHDHSSDTEGGEDIAPVSLSPGGISLEDTEQFTFGDSDDAALEYDPNAGSSGAFVQSGTPMRVTGGTLTAQGSPAISAEGGEVTGVGTINSDGAADINIQRNGSNRLRIRGDRVRVQNADLRMDDGASIEDGGGTSRVEINSSYTYINDETGRVVYQAQEGSSNNIQAYSNTPAGIYDQEQDGIGVQYDTDASAGVLRTPGAGMRVEGSGVKSGGRGVELQYKTSPEEGRISAYNRNTSTQYPLALYGDPVEVRNGDLRLATAQSIEDGNGVKRFEINGNFTSVRSESGTIGLRLQDGAWTRITTLGTGNIEFQDEFGQSTFTAFEYLSTDPAPGTLELTNADLDMGSNAIENASSVDTELVEYGEADLKTDSVTGISISASGTKTIEFSNLHRPLLGLLTIRVGEDGDPTQSIGVYNSALWSNGDQNWSEISEVSTRGNVSVDSIALNADQNLEVTISELSDISRTLSMTVSTNSIIEDAV